MMNEKTDNSRFEQYKRLIKFAGSAVIVLVEFAVYFYAWMNWYNKNMTVAFYRRGNWLIAGEYLVLLVNTTREDCDIIQERINRRFTAGRRTGGQYYVNSVFCSPGR